MDFLIHSAWAQGGAPAGGPGMTDFVLLIVIFAVFYFLLIRPQSKRMKEHKAMIGALAKGDEIVTNGGLLGKITDLGDNFVAIQIAEGVEVKVQKQSVAAVMPKGTVKTL